MMDDLNGPQRGSRGRSGRYLPRRDTPIPAGTLPRDDELHNARLRRSDSENRAWDRDRVGADWTAATAEPRMGHTYYPPPVYNGSNAPAGMRPSDAEYHGRVVPDYARGYAADFNDDTGMV
jgi:hypothetical protein